MSHEYKRTGILDASRVTCLEHLADLVVRAQSVLKSRALWFRGHANLHWQLAPWVFRSEHMANKERNYALRFRAGAMIRYSSCPRDDDFFAWLSFMRHHRVPNRLLDWTGSILVAAYFATERETDKDSVVWAFNPYAHNGRNGGKSNVLSPDDDAIRYLATDAFVRQRHVNPHGGIHAIVAAETSLRMLVQHATFTIHPNDGKPIEDDEKAERFLRGFIVPRECCRKLHCQLEALGINQSSLFPDVESLSDFIRDSEEPFAVT